MKVSIVTVVFNSVSVIEETILSVIYQKNASLEYIVIDGNSTDGTTWTNCSDLSAVTANYTFTMEEKLAGQYRCVVKDNTGTEAVSDVAEVVFEKLSEKEGYVATGKISAIYASDSEKNPGQIYKMFNIAESEAKIAGYKIQVSIWEQGASSGSFTYDAIYIGSKDDEEKNYHMGITSDADNG